MYVHNPLGGGALFDLHTASLDREAIAPVRDEAALRRYRTHAVRLTKVRGLRVPPALLGEDDRDLVARFRRFYPALVERTALRHWIGRVPVVFPAAGVSDARADSVDGRPVTYVSSGKLDAIELVARTVALCTRLNELAVDDFIRLDEPSTTDEIALSWLNVTGDVFPGATVPELSRLDGPGVRETLLGWVRTASPDLRPAYARMVLSRCLTQLTLNTIRRGGEAPDPPATTSPIDAGYLAVLMLTFVVLHEIAHLVLGHNEIGFRGSPDEIAQAETLRTAVEPVAEEFADLLGRGASFEPAADHFAVALFDEPLREPLLEAASLWCTAHVRAHAAGREQVADLLRLSELPDGHPSFALRVRYLNGRLATGVRTGEIGWAIVSAAEAAATELELADVRPDQEAELFRTVLELATPALAPRWTPLGEDGASAAS